MSNTNGANGNYIMPALEQADGNSVSPLGISCAPPETEAHPPRQKASGADRLCLSVRAVWKSRGRIVYTTAAVVAVAIAVAYMLPLKYESTMRLLPAPRSSSAESALQRFRPELGALASLTGVSESQSGTERFVALLKSRVVADRLVRRFDLMRLYHARLRSGARAQLARRTTIQEDRKTGIIAVTVADTNPERAAQMAQAYAEELQKFSVEMNTTGAHLERVFLEGRVKEIETDWIKLPRG